MKNVRILAILSLLVLCVTSIVAQKKKTIVVQKTKPAVVQKAKSLKTIFAVVSDGKQIEPISFIENSKLKPIVVDISQAKGKTDFVKNHYQPKTKYTLIFGGQNVGTATVTKDLAETDCASNQADVSLTSSKVKPKGFLMALATDATPKKNVKGVRALPTSSERAEIEKLVMAEMKGKNVPIKNTGELRYHNLTKIDVDSNGNPEFVGTYWYNTGDKKRSLLFFIAEKDAEGNITIPFKEFGEMEEKDVMSGDIKDLDNGIYHELLIDMFDYDSDGVSEIFTMSQAFEGSNFYAYKRENGKWTKVLETFNYHCAY